VIQNLDLWDLVISLKEIVRVFYSFSICYIYWELNHHVDSHSKEGISLSLGVFQVVEYHRGKTYEAQWDLWALGVFFGRVLFPKAP